MNEKADRLLLSLLCLLAGFALALVIRVTLSPPGWWCEEAVPQTVPRTWSLRLFPLFKEAKLKPTRNPHYQTPTPTNVPTETPTPTSTSASPLPTPTPTATSPATLAFGKCVAQPSQYPPDGPMFQEVGAKLYYNYLNDPPHIPGVQGMPMAWNGYMMQFPMLGDSQIVLGPNECDRPDQCDTSAAAMVPPWYQFEIDNPDKFLVCPAPADVYWIVDFLERFRSAYGRYPRCDALALHWYGIHDSVSGDVENLKTKVQIFRDIADSRGISNLFLTEFAHVKRPVQFLDAIKDWLPNNVEMYCWFASEYPDGVGFWPSDWDNTSLWKNGQLTAIGQAYKEFP